jgi:hypothetical protein
MIWFVIGTTRELLWTRWWTFWFHKMLGNCWVVERQAISEQELISMVLVCSFLESNLHLCISEQSHDDGPSMSEHVMGGVIQSFVGVTITLLCLLVTVWCFHAVSGRPLLLRKNRKLVVSLRCIVPHWKQTHCTGPVKRSNTAWHPCKHYHYNTETTLREDNIALQWPALFINPPPVWMFVSMGTRLFA